MRKFIFMHKSVLTDIPKKFKGGFYITFNNELKLAILKLSTGKKALGTFRVPSIGFTFEFFTH